MKPTVENVMSEITQNGYVDSTNLTLSTWEDYLPTVEAYRALSWEEKETRSKLFKAHKKACEALLRKLFKAGTLKVSKKSTFSPGLGRSPTQYVLKSTS